MRPVVKKQPGKVVEFCDSRGRHISHTVKAEYNPYGDAKAPLIANIGEFCSYCEEPR